jgi:hypothetical protein
MTEEGGRDVGEALLNAESGGEESLRTSPEVRLWLSVLLQAANHLKDSTEWLPESMKSKAPRLPGYDHLDHRTQLSLLHNQVQRHIRRVREAEEFFLGRDSTFGEICQILGYDEARLRVRAEACLREHADAFRKAQAFVTRPGFEDRGMRRRKGRK